jgi:DNA repair exonuclease SbcCD ATPase subunit
MIKQLEIKNFQGHKFTSMSFSPGVNIIKGRSHSGKTSIVRAIKWAILNRPRGEAFRSWFAGKAETLVTIDFGENFIVRGKGKTANYYKVNDTTLEAMRADVPDEVQAITKMNDLNFHSQHDPYFLIQETPGLVAKKLNEVVGLEVIDGTMSRINKLIGDNEYELKSVQEKAISLEEDLEAFSHLDEYENKVKEFDSLYKQNLALDTKIRSLKVALLEIKELREHIDLLRVWLTVEGKLGEIKSLLQSTQATFSKITLLRNAFLSINKERGMISFYSRKLPLYDKIQQLKDLIRESKGLETKSKVISNTMQSIKKERNTIVVQDRQIASLQNTYNQTLKEEGVCPVCKQKIPS